MVMWEILEENLDLEKVEKNEPITTEIRDSEGDMVWRLARMIISDKPIEGAEPGSIVGSQSGVKDKGKWHIKILDELSDEESEEKRIRNYTEQEITTDYRKKFGR
jgi:hypothetical protein